MAIDVWWGSGSPYSWRVLLALEYKQLAYQGHLLQLQLQEQKSPHMLAMNPRGRLPVVKDGDYVVFESVAVLYYLDLKYPQRPLFGRSPEEAAVIMRVIQEFQAYTEPHLQQIFSYVFESRSSVTHDQLTDAMHVAAREARTIEQRLAKSDWIVGESCSATDLVVFPHIMLLLRALTMPVARELSSRFLPVDANYPALGRWLARVESLPGYARTFPPHWRDAAT